MTNLPPGWAEVRLGDIATSVKNGIFVSRPGADPGGVPILRISAVRPGHLRVEDIRYTGQNAEALAEADSLLDPGDLVFTRYNGNIDFVGACAIVPQNVGPLTYPDKLIRVRVAASVASSAFIAYLFQSPRVRPQVRALARTTAGQAGISGASLKSISIPLPPLAEQRRIVGLLDNLLSRWNAGLNALNATTRRADRLREQVMYAAGVGRLAGESSKNSAPPPDPAGVVDGELPDIPGTWQWKRLGEIADVVGGVTKDGKKQADPDHVEVPYLRVANVQRARLDLSKVALIRVSPKKAEQLRLLPGDVLLNEGGDRDKLGRGWIWEGRIPDCIHQNHVFRARIADGFLHSKLLAWHANGGFGRSWFQANGLQSVNLASISLGKMRLFPVPVPPLGVQDYLVKTAEYHLSMLDGMEEAVSVARQRAANLRASLLAEAFAGRLVPQDPDDEHASELLARIRAERESALPKQKARTRRTKKELAAPPTRVTGDDYQQEAFPL
ncbi:restriction endonuclease subunit S [Micromonospora craniellae]|uniref:restriction endonuclease subunit S n=1 Tax=Micromonospora craniellae TaxID=2294034 RepID=UPI0013140955|nr:restriction endonuclease subunit S [Micromonospora craniellae]QOC91136.1 restriction endonuclease subunit S [Micromonospora craniellae]